MITSAQTIDDTVSSPRGSGAAAPARGGVAGAGETAATIAPRARVALVVAAAAILLAIAAVPVAWRARADAANARRLSSDDLALVSSADETRRLTAELRLSATTAALRPGDPAPAERFASDRARLADELRRARLHTDDPNMKDVTDDLENSMLRYVAAAGKVFDAAGAGDEEEARTALAAAERDNPEFEQLADELAGEAEHAAGAHARAVSGRSRALGLILLALVALLVAAHAGAVAWDASRPALATLLIAGLPRSLHRYVPAPSADVDAACLAHSSDEDGSGLFIRRMSRPDLGEPGKGRPEEDIIVAESKANTPNDRGDPGGPDADAAEPAADEQAGTRSAEEPAADDVGELEQDEADAA